MYLITGEESMYQKYEFLKKTVLENIEKGIREGIHQGSEYNVVFGEKATKTTFHFYQGELFKIRWSFTSARYPNLPEVANKLNQQITNQFGNPYEEIALMMNVWNGDKNYLQTFYDEQEFQIELRDKKINTIVENL